jgi:hypothetical protein
MPDEQGLKSFFQTIPGILTAIATKLTAVTALVIALNQLGPPETPSHPNSGTGSPTILLPTLVADGAAAASSETQSEQALLNSFRGCWLSPNTWETIESREATGTSPLPRRNTLSYHMKGGNTLRELSFCLKARDDGTVYFDPPSAGDVAISQAERNRGIRSGWVQWTALGVRRSDHQFTVKQSAVWKYTVGDETEESNLYACRLEGSQLECTVESTIKLNNDPWFRRLIVFTCTELSN